MTEPVRLRMTGEQHGIGNFGNRKLLKSASQELNATVLATGMSKKTVAKTIYFALGLLNGPQFSNDGSIYPGSTMRLISYFKAHPLQTGLLLMAAYFVYFISPDAFGPESFGRGTGIESAQDMGDQLGSELFLTASILAVVGILGWWKACGFTLKTHKGGMKFILPPLIFTLVILVFAMLSASEESQTIITIIGPGALALLILVSFLVGVFEETLFRGVVLTGWKKRYGPVIAMFVSSVLFGVFHFVNWATGQPFGETVWQVVHAGFIGVLYGALWLRIGSIYPVIFLHGFWDATVIIMDSTTMSLAAATAEVLMAAPEVLPAGGFTISSTLFSSLEPAYGLFVLWRWNVWRKRQVQQV